MPRHVRIVDAIPLTAVGKIFKPALRRREVKDALERALREASVPFRALEIVDDSRRGLAAELRLENAGGAGRARETLGRFAVPFTIAVPA